MKIAYRRLIRSIPPAVAVAVALVAGSVALADFAAKDWHYFKQVSLPASAGAEILVGVTPDAELYAGAADGINDVRIVDDDTQREVAYKVVISEATKERGNVPANIRDLGYVSDQHTVFTADINQATAIHNAIEILSPTIDVRRKVVVEASDDGSGWIVLEDDQEIFDFTDEKRDFNARKMRISYPQTTLRQLRVRILDAGDDPLEVTGATVSYVTDIPAQFVAYPTTAEPFHENDQRQVSESIVDLGQRGLPSSAVNILTEQTNFFRRVAVESSANQAEWKTLQADGPIYSYDTPKFVGKDITITFPETTDRYLRLTIENEDNPPLSVREIEVSGIARRIVFQVSPGKSYRLYYGNADARQPSYELEHIFPYLTTDTLPQATLGVEVENPEFKEEVLPLTERLPWLLPVTIGIALAAVGAILLRVLVQARKVLPPPS